MCPGARRDEPGGEQAPWGGCICRSGSLRRMPGIILTLIPITQCIEVWAAQEALPQPSCLWCW